jgi:hypothetical protein
MDCDATLDFPLALVFAHLSAPALLGDWLSEVVRVGSTPLVPAGIGVTFGLTLCREERDLAATGEVIAYEPPAMTAYRIVAGPHVHVVRLSCAASGAGTRLRIHQASAGRLAVDVGRLEQALARRGMPHGAVTDTKRSAVCRDHQPTGGNAPHKTGERNQP